MDPLCPMCNTPAATYGFLRSYQDYRLDLIKVCCQRCVPQFEALSEDGQVSRLRLAMINAYGETSVIYALHYDETDVVHHIGRTKNLKRRMSEYRRGWHQSIHRTTVLEDVPFGALSMEHETRWMLHALKHGWPIDNFHLNHKERQASLTSAVADFEPLTVSFEVLAPFLRQFTNTLDAQIVHWLIERYPV